MFSFCLPTEGGGWYGCPHCVLMQAIAFYIVKSISDHIMCACGTCARKKKLSRKQPSELYVCLSFKVHLTINSHTQTDTNTLCCICVAGGPSLPERERASALRAH